MVAVYAVQPCASTRQALLALPSGTDCSTDEAAVAVGTAGPAAAPNMSLLLIAPTERAIADCRRLGPLELWITAGRMGLAPSS